MDTPIKRDERVIIQAIGESKEKLNDKWKDDSSPIRPHYYAKYKIDPWTFCIENELTLPQGSVIKYVTRFQDKNGLEDLQKAEKCIKMMIQHYYPESQKEAWNA